ncbi:MAG: hypothetical protein ACI9WU_003244, partial [Myxococcota bacterium]
MILRIASKIALILLVLSLISLGCGSSDAPAAPTLPQDDTSTAPGETPSDTTPPAGDTDTADVPDPVEPLPTLAPSQPTGGFDYYADLYNTLGHTDSVRVRGRLVHEDGMPETVTTTPLSQLSQDEATARALSLWINNTQIAALSTDDEGYFDHRADIAIMGLEPGIYSVQARVDNVVAGHSEATLLALDHTQAVLRSDVDLTYLNTDFHTWDAMAALMIEDASDRDTLPGMAAVYQKLARPTVFLSGSPRFFKRILEGKMELDSVDNAGVILKPYKDLVVLGLWDFDPLSIVPSLKEQIGYKLTRLLQLRQDLPPSAQEILMGDDSEADQVVYNLYQRFTSGALSTEQLLAAVQALDVADPWLSDIQLEAPRALQALAGHPF